MTDYDVSGLERGRWTLTYGLADDAQIWPEGRLFEVEEPDGGISVRARDDVPWKKNRVPICPLYPRGEVPEPDGVTFVDPMEPSVPPPPRGIGEQPR